MNGWRGNLLAMLQAQDVLEFARVVELTRPLDLEPHTVMQAQGIGNYHFFFVREGSGQGVAVL